MSCLASLQQQFFASLFNGLAIGSIYALIALGLTMVYGILNLINFAHGEIFMIGAFAALGVLSALGVSASSSGLGITLAIAAAALAAMAASGAAAMLLEVVAYRPLRRRGAPRHAAMISGLGCSVAIQETFALAFGRGNLPYPSVFPLKTLLVVESGRITSRMVLIMICTLGMMILLDRVVMHTRLGRGIRALAQDPVAAGLMGVNISRAILVTFLIGGLCAGLGGVLYGIYFSKTSYMLGFIPGLKGLTAAILGGVGNLPGAVLGGLLLGLMENLGGACLPGQLKDVVGFGALLLVLVFRPQGLLGERLARRT
ncbi:branched-chain amino acid ABC transporter permease [Lichenifustis flavocetrariae]|uniref:Branched-chain amino acid ABC transporter permease n=1 Tax=Lichenifustis flavocetrariae TaxID=2949735 RepID=A0AA42CL45_9HYPH|nr:branched-chain amino acid ABC transporter permease [Lichenifustis flavocetrariae]MCW6511208.1 branched-chain amino acid ABC transporter permease [Lichenifustis flavocetrariae]